MEIESGNIRVSDIMLARDAARGKSWRKYNRDKIHKFASWMIREKYDGKCYGCGRAGRLMHHQDGDKNNDRMDNLVWICISCHASAHAKMRKYGNYRISHFSEVFHALP